MIVAYIVLNLILGFANFLFALSNLDKGNNGSALFSAMVSGFCFGIVITILIFN